VPNLTCNHMPVARLVKDLNCTMTFCDDFSILQDRTSRTLIGVGEQRDVVYFYKKALVVKDQVNVMMSRDLWHNRMEHPSSEVFTTLHKSLGIFNAIKNSERGV